jgi:hypothetical protein
MPHRLRCEASKNEQTQVERFQDETTGTFLFRQVISLIQTAMMEQASARPPEAGMNACSINLFSRNNVTSLTHACLCMLRSLTKAAWWRFCKCRERPDQKEGSTSRSASNSSFGSTGLLAQEQTVVPWQHRQTKNWVSPPPSSEMLSFAFLRKHLRSNQ